MRRTYLITKKVGQMVRKSIPATSNPFCPVSASDARHKAGVDEIV